jgi:hypothetical protein
MALKLTMIFTGPPVKLQKLKKSRKVILPGNNPSTHESKIGSHVLNSPLY